MRITDVPMVCPVCGFECTVYECEHDCDGEGSLGCPQPDCGTVMEMKQEAQHD